MEITKLKENRQFNEAKMQKIPLFDTDKMFCDQYCLLPNQAQRVHSHDAEDKIYIILEGEALFDIGGEQETHTEGHAVIARAGVPHGVRNNTKENLVLLVFMAPRPIKHS